MLNEYILIRIRSIQQELQELERVVTSQIQNPVGRIKLKGLWKGVQVSDADFKNAQRAIFKDAYTVDA